MKMIKISPSPRLMVFIFTALMTMGSGLVVASDKIVLSPTTVAVKATPLMANLDKAKKEVVIPKTTVAPKEPAPVIAKVAAPEETPVVNKQGRLWNLQDADILSVINEVSQETGKNFVIDPRVSGKITLISSKPLKDDEVYQVFLSVLGLLGYSAIPNGEVVKIVPNMESGEQATQVATGRQPGRGDEVVVRVVPLVNISAAQLIPVIRPMLPQWSNIASYTPGNVLILLGRADNLTRIMSVIQEVDSASNTSIQMVPLKHAAAAQVATVLNNLQAAARASGNTASVSIGVDERSNSLLLSGPKALRVKMRVLIAQLDAPAAAAEGNTEVIYLRYLQAKKLAPLLSRIAANIMGKSASAAAGGGAPSGLSNAASNTYSVSKELNATSNSSGSDKNETQESEADDEPVASGMIQAEVNTNAIIITAQPALMKALKAVIAKLDIRPAQVLVQAIIAEVEENDLASLGIQWGNVESDGKVSSSGSSITSFPSLGAGIVGIIPGAKIKAVLSVLQNQNGVDILSTPSIMVLDNQKATIEVGQDVPFQTGSYATTGAQNTVTPFSTVDQKAVTLKLDVTPQINLATSVRLKLDLKNDTLQNPQNPGLTPIINTSKINNSVIINSDDILVLGGLISKSNNENINKVPILGDLPVVGTVFQQKTHSRKKKNLMVFIKPVILSDSQDAMSISQDKYMTMREAQANFSDNLQDIGNGRVSTLLPPWKGQRDLPKPFETKQ